MADKLPPAPPNLLEDERFAQARRQVYLAALGLGAVLMTVAVFSVNQSTQPEFYIRVFGPICIGLALLDIWWLATGRSLRVSEVAGYVVLASLAVIQVSVVASAPQPPSFYPNSGPYWMLLCVIALGFVVFETALAGRLTTLLTFLCLGLPWLIQGPYVMQNPLAVLRMQLSVSVVVLLLWGLAWFHGQYRKQVQSHQLWQRLTFTDPLTGLHNRRAVYLTVADLLRHAARGQPGAVLLLDVDHFKQVNLRHGHVAGDEILVHVARLLRRLAEEQPAPPTLPAPELTVGRWGGEEFIVVLRDISPHRAAEWAEELRRAFHTYNWPLALNLTASLGLCSVRPGDDFTSLLTRADEALQQAKRSGRDRVEALLS